MKYIYMFENLKNGKIYVGQSKNPQKRFSTHMNQHSSKDIATDVGKFGKDNFKLTILEKCNEEDFQQREQYYIAHYKQMGKTLYNKTKGGEEPPTLYGKDNKFFIYTDEQLENVIDLLQNTDYTFLKISEISKTSKDFVTKVNNGVSRIKEYLDYPLRKENHFDKIVNLIINDLLNTKLNQREISDKYGVCRSMITMINIGKNHRNKNLEYPIRKNPNSISKEIKDSIIKEIIENPNKRLGLKLSKKYNIGYSSINKIKKSIL